MKPFLFGLSAALVFAGRFTVPGHDLSWAGSYEAAAHIWVGWMLALSFQKDKRAMVALGILTVFETVMFLAR